MTAALLPLLLAACGSRAKGYGVVLWGDLTNGPQTGAVVAIIRDTLINGSVLISLPGEKTPRDFAVGKLRQFKTRAEAAAFAAAFQPSLASWAIVTKTDDPPLPIRETASPDGKVVYKLAPKQLVKVVSRSASPVDVKPYTDYWYEVVTEDGYGGFCFGHFLKTFTAAGDPAAEADKLRAQDDTLAQVMGNTWRPDWFADMASKGALDLTMFREDVGMFPQPDQNMIRLVLPLQTFEFHYTAPPVKEGTRSYTFPGTELRIDVLDPEGGRINITYRQSNNQLVTRLYVTMADDVAAIIAAEQKRRTDIYTGLLSHGATLTSSAYGTIHLAGDMTFTWEGFSKLVPSLIGPNAKGKGTVDFTLHVSKDIAGDYDGAITFLFDEYPNTGVSFLYKAASSGLRFTSLGKDSVQDLFVQSPSPAPTVIFFTQSP